MTKGGWSAAQLRLLGLSPKEAKVFAAVRSGEATPTSIATHTKLSRPTVYDVLRRLQRRCLVTKKVQKGQTRWLPTSEQVLEQELLQVRKGLFQFAEGVETVQGISSANVFVHRGAKAIRTLLYKTLRDQKGQRHQAFQGDLMHVGWDKVFNRHHTKRINTLIKQVGVIIDALVPHGWHNQQYEKYGDDWVRDFMGRTTVMHELDRSFFRHGAQIAAFKDVVLLMAMNEELIIEIRNSEIQKAIRAMMEHMREHAEPINFDKRMKLLLEKSKK